MACLRAEWAAWAAWAEWTTKPSANSLAKAINNSRVPKGARLFWFAANARRYIWLSFCFKVAK